MVTLKSSFKMSHVRLIGAARKKPTILSTKRRRKEDCLFHLMASTHQSSTVSASHTRTPRRIVDLDAVPASNLRPTTDYKGLVNAFLGKDKNSSRIGSSQNATPSVDLVDVTRTFAGDAATMPSPSSTKASPASTKPSSFRDPISFLDSVPSDKIIRKKSTLASPSSSSFEIKTGLTKRRRNVAWAWMEEAPAQPGEDRGSTTETSISEAETISLRGADASPSSPAARATSRERGTVTWESLEEEASEVRPRLDVNEILLKSSQLRKVRDERNEGSDVETSSNIEQTSSVSERSSWEAMERNSDSGPMTITTTRFLQRSGTAKSSAVELIGANEIKGAITLTDDAEAPSKEAFLFDPGGIDSHKTRKRFMSWAQVEALEDSHVLPDSVDFVARELEKYDVSKSRTPMLDSGKPLTVRPKTKVGGLTALDVRSASSDISNVSSTSPLPGPAISASFSIPTMEESGKRGIRSRRLRSWMELEASEDASSLPSAERRRDTKEKKKESSAFVDFIKEELFHAGSSFSETSRLPVKDADALKQKPRWSVSTDEAPFVSGHGVSSMGSFAPEVARTALSRRSNDATPIRSLVEESTNNLDLVEVTKTVPEKTTTPPTPSSTEGPKVKLMVKSLEASNRKALDGATTTKSKVEAKRTEAAVVSINDLPKVKAIAPLSDSNGLAPGPRSLWFEFFDNIVQALGWQREKNWKKFKKICHNQDKSEDFQSFAASPTTTTSEKSSTETLVSGTSSHPPASTQELDNQSEKYSNHLKPDLTFGEVRKSDSVVGTDKAQYYKEFWENLKKLR